MKQIYLFFLMLFLLILSSTISNAQTDFCEALNTVLADAGNQFVSLRENFDFDVDQYRGTVPMGQFKECMTESGDGVASYECQLRNLPNNEGYAASLLVRLDQDVKNCFGQDLRQNERKNNRIRYSYLPTGDDIKLRYGRIEPRNRERSPFYYISLEVIFIEVAQ